MGHAVLEELVWRGALDEPSRQRVAAQLKRGAGLVETLVGAGVDADEALAVVAQVSGVPIAPKKLVDNPEPPADAHRYLEHGGVAIGTRGPLPCVAFDDADRAKSAQLNVGTPIVPVLVLPAVWRVLSSRLAPSDEFDERTSAYDDAGTAGPSGPAVDVTDPEASDEGPGYEDGGAFVADEDEEEGATVVNDVAALEAMMRAEQAAPSPTQVGPEVRTNLAAPAVSGAFTAEQDGSQAEAGESSIGIDPRLLAAVVQEEVGEVEPDEEGELDDDDRPAHDPATIMTRPFTPEDEALYGNLQTTALKLHVDRAIPMTDDEGLASVSFEGPFDDGDTGSVPPTEVMSGAALRAAARASRPTAGAAGVDPFAEATPKPTEVIPLPRPPAGRRPPSDLDDVDVRPTEVMQAVRPGAAVTAPDAALDDVERRPTEVLPTARSPARGGEEVDDDDIDLFDDVEENKTVAASAYSSEPAGSLLAEVDDELVDAAAGFDFDDGDNAVAAAPTMPRATALVEKAPRPTAKTAVPVATISELPSATGGDVSIDDAVTRPTPAGLPVGGKPKSKPAGKPSSSSGESAPAGARYEVKSVLGRGGMATVYLARDHHQDRDVALKILEAHLASDEMFVERFRREMRATESLDHPNVMRCFDAGESDGRYFIAAEYVDGGTLAQLMRQVERLPIPLVVGIIEQALKGLDYAHQSGTIHRDLKPANLMFNKSGALKIADFGIAKTSTDTTITQTGTLFGTPAYMSPEQATGKDIDTRSDLFSIGIVFYQMLTGENPFHFDNPSTSLFRISSGLFPPLFDREPAVPRLLDQVVTRLLARSRDERYPNAQAALDELAPLIKAVRSRHPDIEARMLRDPPGMDRMLRDDESSLHVAHGKALLKFDPPRTNEGAFHFFLGAHLYSENYEATNALAQLRVDEGIRFDHDLDPRIEELEAAMGVRTGEFRGTPAQLRRAVDLHVAAKDLLGTAKYLLAYSRLMPHDAHMQMRLKDVLGTDVLAPFSPIPVPRKTARTTADDEIVPGLAPAGAAIRQRADPRAPASPMVAPSPAPTARAATAVDEPRTPAGVAAPPSAAGPTSSGEGEAPAPLPPAKDSLEAVVRLAQEFWREVVRSITGDQGTQVLREWWNDRFGKESREELKREAKVLLAQSKGALTEQQKKLLEETKREPLIPRLRTAWGKHRRLILTAGAVIVTYSLLSYGCSVACGLVSSDGPPPTSSP